MALTLTLVMATRKSIADDPHKAVNLALGKRLAQLRTLRNLSQRELAERVNVVQVVVSNYEIGKLRITAEMALRFAAALDVRRVFGLGRSRALFCDGSPSVTSRLLYSNRPDPFLP